MRRGLSLAMVLVVSLVVLASGCGAAKASDEPYKVGAVFSVTGPNAPLGVPEKDTVMMIEEQVNAKGGINGHPLKVIVYDDESDETKAVAAVKKLISEDKVVALVGSSGSGPTLAMVDTVEKSQIPLVSAAASIKIVQPVKKWVFKTAQSDVHAIQRLLEYLQAQGITKVALLHDSNAFGVGGKEQLQQLAPQAGIAIVDNGIQSYGSKDTDMTVQLTKVKDSGAQAIIVWGTNPGPAIIAKNMKQLGMTIPLFQSHGIANAKFIELAGDAANGVVFPAGKLLVADSLPDSEKQKAVLLEYGKDFQAKYGRPADTFGGHAWDALQLVVRAMQKAGDDKAKIRDEIENTKDFVGISGVFNFTAQEHNGLTKDAFAMIKIENNKWTRAE